MADATQSFLKERKKILGKGPFPLHSLASLQFPACFKEDFKE